MGSCTLWVSSCVTQPVGCFREPKENPEFFYCLWVFQIPKTQTKKPIIHCHYPQELQKIHTFLKALGCPTFFYYCFVTQLVLV